MSPRRVNAFEEGYVQEQALVESQPVENENLFILIDSLERTGLQMSGAGKLKMERFAEVMHETYVKLADVEIVPPMSTDQKQLVAGKVATYAALRENTAQKSSRAAKKTDNRKIPTDKRK